MTQPFELSCFQRITQSSSLATSHSRSPNFDLTLLTLFFTHVCVLVWWRPSRLRVSLGGYVILTWVGASWQLPMRIDRMSWAHTRSSVSSRIYFETVRFAAFDLHEFFSPKPIWLFASPDTSSMITFYSLNGPKRNCRRRSSQTSARCSRLSVPLPSVLPKNSYSSLSPLRNASIFLSVSLLSSDWSFRLIKAWLRWLVRWVCTELRSKSSIT